MLQSSYISKFIEQFPQSQNIYIAYSGGLDSTVLLHLISQIRNAFPNNNFIAVHVNHGISPHAKKWQEHCQKIAHDLQIQFKSFEIDMDLQKGESLEEKAREKRYEIFANVISANDLVLTAHQQDDQVETFLLQLFRGSGVNGLSAMSECKKFHQGFLLRPLLSFTRKDLELYAKENNLIWIEDESNLNLKFKRNYIRHQIIPEVQKAWPAVSKTIFRASHLMQESSSLLQEIAEEDLLKCRGSFHNTISMNKLLLLSDKRQKNLLHYYFIKKNLSLPNYQHIEKIFDEVINAKKDANPILHFGDVEVRRYQDDLYIMKPLIQHDKTRVFSWDLKHDSKLILPNNLGIITAEATTGNGIKIQKIQKLSVRFRQGGEVIKQQNHQHHHDLKKLMQEWCIPSWLRDRIPLIYLDEQLAVVVGYAIADEFVANDDEEGWMFHHSLDI